jgi:hypothetical protein
LTDVVPFLVEDMLKAQGGVYSKTANCQLAALCGTRRPADHGAKPGVVRARRAGFAETAALTDKT